MKLLLTIDEVAEALAWGRTATYAKVLSGEIGSVKLNKSRRVPVAALEAYVRRLQGQAESAEVGQ